MANAFSDTSATNSPSNLSDDSPLLIIEDSDLADNKKQTNDDPLDPNNFPPLPSSRNTDVLQSHWQDQAVYHSNLSRSRHVSESSNLSLPRSRHVSESSSSSLSQSRYASDSSSSSLSHSRYAGSESSNSSLPRSRHVSERSISPPSHWPHVFEGSPPCLPDEFSNCEKHSYPNEFFCYNCYREICKDCATGNHQGHNFKPGFTYRQIFFNYRLNRNYLQEHKVKGERALKNLVDLVNLLVTELGMYFQKIHEIVDARERKLREEAKHAFEFRKLLINSRSFEADKALSDGDQIMDTLFKAYKTGNTEKLTQTARSAMKHLDSMQELVRRVDVPVDDIYFVPHQDEISLSSELNSLGSIVHSGSRSTSTGCPSENYNSSWNSNCFSWNGTPESNSSSKITPFNEINHDNRFNDFKGSNTYVGTSSSYNQPTSLPPTQFDSAPSNYNPFTSFVPSEPQFPGSAVENLALALAALRESSLSQSPSALPLSPSTVPPSPSDPFQSNLSMFPFCNTTIPSPNVQSPLDAPKGNFKSSANINIPPSNRNAALSANQFNRSARRMGANVDRGFQRKRCPPNNEFRVSIHTDRDYTSMRKPVVVFGQEGKGDTDLCRPWGVCCDDKDHVIVADRSNNRIQIFRTDGTHVRHFGEAGSEEGQFNRPAGVAVDLHGRIVVCDKDNHRIQVFTLEGTLCLCFGRRGSAVGQFNYPWDVAVASVTGIYAVSDTRNHRIQIFTDQGCFLKQFGYDSKSPTWRLFDSPRGVCFTPDSTLLCTEFNHHCIFEIEFMGNGARIIRLEQFKDTQKLHRPQKITMDSEGNVLVTDCRNNRIVVFPREGMIKWFGVAGKEHGQFDRPSGMCVTPDGKIVVVDFGNHRIQIF